MQKFASEMHLDRGVGHKKRQFAENRRGLRTCKEIWLSFHDNFFLLLGSSINNIIYFPNILSPTSHLLHRFLPPEKLPFYTFWPMPPPTQRYTYRELQTIQMKLILLCVQAERAVLGSAKTALKFKHEI